MLVEVIVSGDWRVLELLHWKRFMQCELRLLAGVASHGKRKRLVRAIAETWYSMWWR